MWYINEKTKGFSALYKAIKNKSSSEKIVVYFNGTELEYDCLTGPGLPVNGDSPWVRIHIFRYVQSKESIILSLNSQVKDHKTLIESRCGLTLSPVDKPKCIQD